MYFDYLENLHNVKWKFLAKLKGLEESARVVNQTTRFIFDIFDDECYVIGVCNNYRYCARKAIKKLCL